MTAAVLVGVLGGTGLLLLLVAVLPPAAPPAARILAVDNAVPSESISTGMKRFVHNVATSSWMKKMVGTDLTADLRVTGTDPTAHLIIKVSWALVVLIVGPPFIAFVVFLLGVNLLITPLLVLIMVCGGFLAPDLSVRRDAAEVRQRFVSEMSAYLDLVALRAAGGSGVHEALRDASDIGDGNGWFALQATLRSARLAGQPPSAGLIKLGEHLQISELIELGGQLQVVDATGAQTEATLRSKAAALRDKERTQSAGVAAARANSMVIGQFLLALGYLILLMWPALSAILGQS